MAAQAGLCLAGSKTPEDTFCHDEAHFHLVMAVIKLQNKNMRYPNSMSA